MSLPAIFALLLLTLCRTACAEPVALSLAAGMDGIDARAYARYYDEPAPLMSFAEARVRPDLFQPAEQRAGRLGAAMHWIYLPLRNDGATPGRWLLSLGVPDAKVMRIEQLSSDGATTLLDLAPNSPYTARPLAERMLAVPVALAPGERAELFIRYRTHGNSPLTLELVSPQRFQQQLATGNLINGIVLGVLLALALFALLQYLAAEQNAFIAYVGMAVLMVAFLMQFEGYNFAYFWPEYGAWNQVAPAYLVLGVQAAHTLFALALFDMRRRFPGFHRAFLAYLVLLPASLLLYLSADLAWPMLATGLLYVPLVLVAGIHFVRSGHAVAGVFLAGTIANTLFTNILFGLSVNGFNFGVDPFVYPKIGYVCEALIFALALARQMQALRRLAEDGLRRHLVEVEHLARVEREKHQALVAAQQQQLQLAAAGHDLSQPLASMRLALTALRVRAGNEAVAHHLDQALDYTESLLRNLIDDAKQAHAEQRHLMRLEDALVAARQRHLAAAQAKGLRLRLRSSPYRIRASELVLARILDNLLGNAIRHTAHGQILLGVRRRVGGLEIQVLDTGPGFDLAQHRRLLAPFEQGSVLAGERIGHGLGLHIVQALCAESGYRLTIRSTPGCGSTFGVCIPHAA